MGQPTRFRGIDTAPESLSDSAGRAPGGHRSHYLAAGWRSSTVPSLLYGFSRADMTFLQTSLSAAPWWSFIGSAIFSNLVFIECERNGYSEAELRPLM